MKLIMTLLVRDEEDILRENIEFHLAQGIDFFVAMDNNSIDNTTAILKEYEEKGVLKYYQQKQNDYKQEEWVTFLSKEASSTYDADWVINNDADEFWFPKYHKTLKEVFLSIGVNKNLLVAERLNFVTVETQEPTSFYKAMIYKEKFAKNPKGKPLSPKVCYKASRDIIVAHGNHGIESGLTKILPVSDLIDIFHFPIRSQKQYESKIINIGSGLKQNHKHTKNIRAKFYEEYQKDKEYLKRQYNAELHTEEMISSALEKGILVEDTRLKEFLEELLNYER